MNLIRTHDYRWYRQVPRIGEGEAKRLVAWLLMHSDSLRPVSSQSLAPVRQLGPSSQSDAGRWLGAAGATRGGVAV